ncbi:hypothetical protein Vretifemale_10894, partial [Volvox reticuliferus]
PSSAGPSTPRKLSSHALGTFAGDEIDATASGMGGAAAMEPSQDKLDAPWGPPGYGDYTSADVDAAGPDAGESDRRIHAHYGLISAQIAQAKQREHYLRLHAAHSPDRQPQLEAPAELSGLGAEAAGAGWEVFVGLDPALFAAPDQDGPACSVLMPPGVSGGSLAAPAPPLVVSEIPAVPLTMERPAPRNLPDFMEHPGEPWVTATPDKFHPRGHPMTPPEGSLTSLQQHFAFFDINKDGVITLGECITGFRFLLRRLLSEPLNTLAAVPVALAVQLPLSWLAGDSWLPDPRLLVHVRNAHK